MEFSLRHVGALLRKELKDFSKNVNVLLMCILPIAFSLIYTNLFTQEEISKIHLLTLCLGMSLSLVSSYVIAMLIAEEKEKYTLRTLMLSSVSPLEFLTGKALVSLLSSIACNTVIFLIVGVDLSFLPEYLLYSSLVCISMVEIGAVIGILSANQMATGVLGVPIIMFFLMIPMFASFNPVLEKIAQFLPNHNLFVLLRSRFNGESFNSESILNLGVILVWILVSGGIFAYAYRKKGLDN